MKNLFKEKKYKSENAGGLTNMTNKEEMKELKRLAIKEQRGIFIKLDLKSPFIIFEGVKYPIKDAIVVHAKKDYNKFFCYDSGEFATTMPLEDSDDDSIDNSFIINKYDILSEEGELLKKGLKLYFYQDECFELLPKNAKREFYEFTSIYLYTKDFVFVCTVEYDDNDYPTLLTDCTTSKKTKNMYKALVNNIAKLMFKEAIQNNYPIISNYLADNLEGDDINE